jgi:hypothetical protein
MTLVVPGSGLGTVVSISASPVGGGLITPLFRSSRSLRLSPEFAGGACSVCSSAPGGWFPCGAAFRALPPPTAIARTSTVVSAARLKLAWIIKRPTITTRSRSNQDQRSGGDHRSRMTLLRELKSLRRGRFTCRYRADANQRASARLNYASSHSGLMVGRYWTRTSDPCDVNAQPYPLPLLTQHGMILTFAL